MDAVNGPDDVEDEETAVTAPRQVQVSVTLANHNDEENCDQRIYDSFDVERNSESSLDVKFKHRIVFWVHCFEAVQPNA